jgi:hypothetical protein
MRAREIILALLIILAGAFLTGVKTGRIDISWDEFNGEPFRWRGTEFIFEETQDIPAPAPVQIEVQNSHGAVDIEVSDTGRVQVLFRKRVWRKDQAEAKAVADRLRMIINRGGEGLVLSTNREEFPSKRFETDFKILVPAGTAVLVKNSYGPVKAAGMGRTELINSHGRVSAAMIGGELIIRTSYESVDVDGVLADCRIEAPHGEVNARNIQGQLLVDSSYKNIRVERIAKKLTIVGSHSDILARDLQGEAEIGSSYESIKVAGARAVKIRGHQSDIEVLDLKGAADIVNDHGSVRAERIEGAFKVEGNNVQVWAQAVSGGDIDLSTSYQNVELFDISGKTTVVLTHGDLRLRPRDLAGPIDVQGSYAAVDLEWPTGLRTPFEAKTLSGEIHWGLAEKPSFAKTNGSSETKAFIEETGKPLIRISTTYGDIRVSDAAAKPPSN